MLSTLTATMDVALVADAAHLRAYAEAMLEVTNAVEHLVDGGEIARTAEGVTVLAARYDDLVAIFTAWRAFVERGVPFTWRLAGETSAPDDEIESLF